MKTTKLLLAFIALTAILFTACKKDHAKSTQEKLQAKWSFKKEYYHDNYSGVDYRDTTIGSASDYVDFRTNNKLYTNWFGGQDTADYSLIGDDKIRLVFSGTGGTIIDTVTIQKLTDNELEIYNKKFDPAPDYYESTDYFTK